MPDFEVNPAALPGFDGYFTLTDVRQTKSTVNIDIYDAYRASVTDLMSYFSQLPVAKLSSLPSLEQAVVRAKQPIRDALVVQVRVDADNFCDNKLDPLEGLRRLGVYRGRYEQERERLERRIFHVLDGDDGKNPPSYDFSLEIQSGTAQGQAVPEKTLLYAEATAAKTIVETVCDRMALSGAGGAHALRIESRRRLAGICRVGLEGDYPGIATAALNAFKTEFFLRQSGKIKRKASFDLLRIVIYFVLIMFAAYFFVRWTPFGYDMMNPREIMSREETFFVKRKVFFLMAAGAAIGTWLSFVVRSLDIQFSDLATVEEEFLGPEIRVAFVVMLTIGFGLIFWTQAFSIKIGDMNVAPTLSGGTAMLVGLFMGVSERALSLAFTSQAAKFVSALGSAGRA